MAKAKEKTVEELGGRIYQERDGWHWLTYEIGTGDYLEKPADVFETDIEARDALQQAHPDVRHVRVSADGLIR